jgi:hypothetical protein
MGTNTCFFFTINLSKVPIQVFFWNNIHIKTLLLAGTMIPVIALGAIFGASVIKRLKEKVFRYLVIYMTLIAAVRLL